MSNQRHLDLARRIIEDNQHLSLATVTNEPESVWVATLTYVYDDQFILYFMSANDARHIQDIKRNPQVTAAIYDSRQQWGHGLGLQVSGKVEKVHLGEYPRMMQLFFRRSYPYGGVPNVGNIFEQVIQARQYRFYKFIPQRVWVTDPDAEVDGRIQVAFC